MSYRIGNWYVYKVEECTNPWKWVARSQGEVHIFPTKSKAVQFVNIEIMKG